MSKDDEYLPARSEAFVYLTAICLMDSRVAAPSSLLVRPLALLDQHVDHLVSMAAIPIDRSRE